MQLGWHLLSVNQPISERSLPSFPENQAALFPFAKAKLTRYSACLRSQRELVRFFAGMLFETMLFKTIVLASGWA